MEINVSSTADRNPWLIRDGEKCDVDQRQIRAALLTNLIAPYFLPVLHALHGALDSLRVFVSTAMEDDRPWESVWDGLDVTVQRSFARRHSRAFKEGFSTSFVRYFPYDTLPLLHRYRPDVIVSAQLGFRTVQAVAYRQFRKSCRLVIWADLSMHTEREVGAGQTFIRRFLLRFADAVLVNGYSGYQYIKSLGVSEHRIVIAPYVTEMAPFVAAPLTREAGIARRLLFVGQLVEAKGLRNFVIALARWGAEHPGQRCEMWFVGDGPLRRTLEEFPIPSNVLLRFYGNVPYNEIHTYYANAGILVFPTLSDTWGLVVNEALGSGLPVLGSKYSQAVEELVTDGLNGWTFYADRPKELQDALARALACPLARLSEMSEESRRVITGLTPSYSARCFMRAIGIATSPEGVPEALRSE